MNRITQEPLREKALNKNDFIVEIYNRYGKKLYGYAVFNWKLNEDEAWDLIYKTLYKVLASHKNYRFESEEKFGAFIFKIFINYLRNYYRDNKKEIEKHVFLDSLKVQIPDIPVAREIETELMKALKKELEKMDDWQRVLLLMRSDGMAYSEIAKYVEKPEGQLKVYYQRLKAKISKKLNGKF